MLQHNPPPVARYILEILTELANHGAILYFQILTFRDGYSFDAQRYLSTPPANDMEVHCLAQRDLFEILNKGGCQILEIMEDSWAGSGLYLSNTVVALKSRTDADVPRPRAVTRSKVAEVT